MYTLVSTHVTPVEAYIIKGRLEADGVVGVVLFEHHVWANWSLSNALGGVRVLVPHAMADSAREVARQIHSGEYEKLLLEEQGLSVLSCPSCGSSNTGAHVWLWKLALAFLFALSLPVPYTSHLHSCDDCKHSWIAHDQRPYPLIAIAFCLALISCCFFLVFMALRYFIEWEVAWR